MAFIRPQVKVTEEALTVKIDVSVLAELKLYAEFLASSQAYIVTETLRTAFRKDRAFAEWKKQQHGSAPAAPSVSNSTDTALPK